MERKEMRVERISGSYVKVSCGKNVIILEAVEVFNHRDRGLAVYRPEIKITHENHKRFCIHCGVDYSDYPCVYIGTDGLCDYCYIQLRNILGGDYQRCSLSSTPCSFFGNNNECVSDGDCHFKIIERWLI